ncbi:SGNH/GDSL hydrolase family protein [Lactiplantibacillus modestisalitolerans]|uniref:SGNH/GDSL hydrolase family protein n=1 Tax=Lactiplantibacillus modestisalitolerans TaxID=1457219 RepID=A0ABV5WSW5_9LACO|nr:SGNH/GDSL hydrolase family protein [Lactiplantibacillus modestisalitolerans]
MTTLDAAAIRAQLKTYRYPQRGAWHGEVYELRKREVTPAVPEKGAQPQLHFKTLVEQCPALNEDAATVGTFTYYQGTHLVIAAEAQNYQLKLRLQNTVASAQTYTAIVNDLETVTFTLAGTEAKTVTLDVALTTAQLDLTFMNLDAPETGGCFELTALTMTRQPLAAAPYPRVVIASDSTAQTYTQAEYPQTGWGAVLSAALFPQGQAVITPDAHATYSLARIYQHGKFTILNKSIGGRSARSFIAEGKLASLAAGLRPNDYLLIQFGDNDATSYRPMRYIAPERFPNYLNQFVDSALARGAHPILVTPPSQHKFDGTVGHIGFGPYREQVLKLAQERQLPCIDLGKLTADVLTEMGPDVGRALYMQFAAGQYPGFPGGVHDNTHFNRYGAHVLARLVAEQFAKLQTDYQLTPVADAAKVLSELSAEVEPKRHVRLRWQPVTNADFYRVQRTGYGADAVGFTALQPSFLDETPCQNPTYRVCAYRGSHELASAVIQVPLTSEAVETPEIAGINVYEVDRETDPQHVGFSLRFIAHPHVTSYWVYLISQRTHEKQLLGKIPANQVDQLHSYQAPHDGVWLVQIAGQDDELNQRLFSKAVIVK